MSALAINGEHTNYVRMEMIYLHEDSSKRSEARYSVQPVDFHLAPFHRYDCAGRNSLGFWT